MYIPSLGTFLKIFIRNDGNFNNEDSNSRDAPLFVSILTEGSHSSRNYILFNFEIILPW